MSDLSHATINSNDTFGVSTRVLTAVIAVLLSIITISAHRTHSAAQSLQKQVSDHWSHYQSKRIRDYQTELNSDLVKVIGKNNAATKSLLSTYAKQHASYSQDLTELRTEAASLSAINNTTHDKALYLDLAAVMLEISLVMSSLYFVAQKKLFPLLGVLFASAGMIAAILGCMLV
jgi:uncharacterized membrane protein YeiB